MNKLFKILKVNILAIIAIPFLIVATLAKMIERSLEKVGTIISMLVFTAVIFGVLAFIDDPSVLISHWKLALAIAGVITIIVFIVRFMLAIANFVIRTILAGVRMIFDTIYKLCYMCYMSLATPAASDFSYLRLTGPTLIYGILCVFYVVLCLLNYLIQAFIRVSLFVFVAITGGFAVFWYINIAESVKAIFGISMMQYLALFDTWSLIKNILIFIVVVADVAVVLISLGIEWTQWSNELSFDEEVQDKILDMLTDDEETFVGIEVAEDDESFEYYEIVSDHLGGSTDLMDETRQALAIEDNPLLENACSEYFHDLSDITGKIAESRGQLDDVEFNKLKPFIKHLDRQREAIYKLIDRQYELLDAPSKNSVFFTGCNSAEKLNKRYKSLCKAYHPDNEGGDEETFMAIKEEYEKLKQRFTQGEENE